MFATNSALATGIPLFFIILLGMGKELYLEFRRWRDDKRVNVRSCRILKNLGRNKINRQQFSVCQEQGLRVGDIVRLRDDDYVPADCIILKA